MGYDPNFWWEIKGLPGGNIKHTTCYMHDDVTIQYDVIIPHKTPCTINSFVHKSFELCQTHTYVNSQVGKQSLNWVLGLILKWEWKGN